VSRVVGLTGNPIVDESGAYTDIVNRLENFLEMAKRGEIIAFALAVVAPNNHILTASEDGGGNRHFLVAACEYLKNDIICGPK
jgi:hypothetical protein